MNMHVHFRDPGAVIGNASYNLTFWMLLLDILKSADLDSFTIYLRGGAGLEEPERELKQYLLSHKMVREEDILLGSG